MPIRQSILERCVDPYDTRRRAAAGEVVPCPTGCLAYVPDTGSGCILVNARAHRREQPEQPAVDQPTLGIGDDDAS